MIQFLPVPRAEYQDITGSFSRNRCRVCVELSPAPLNYHLGEGGGEKQVHAPVFFTMGMAELDAQRVAG